MKGFIRETWIELGMSYYGRYTWERGTAMSVMLGVQFQNMNKSG